MDTQNPPKKEVPAPPKEKILRVPTFWEKYTWINRVLFFAILLVLGAIVFILSSQKSAPQSAQTIPTPTIQSRERTNPGIVTRYTSPELGITFTYVNNNNGLSVWKVGNKVCVTSRSSLGKEYQKKDPDCFTGQYVEVFNKKTSQSLKEAIEEQLLAGYSKTACFVQDHRDKKNYGTVQYAEISYPLSDDPNDPGKNGKKCPEKYSLTE